MTIDQGAPVDGVTQYPCLTMYVRHHGMSGCPVVVTLHTAVPNPLEMDIISLWDLVSPMATS